MLRLRLFGKFKAFDDLGEEIRFESQSSGCVVCLLFMRKGRAMSRQLLGQIIWPDSDPSQQRANLRKALSRLPEWLKSSVVIQTGVDEVSLDYSKVTSDLQEAEGLHRKYLQMRDSDDAPALLESFWKIIRISMLAGWDQSTFDSIRTRYELWADEIGTELAELHEARGDIESASRVWRSILTANPARLEAVKGLMRCESALRGGEHAESVIREVLPSLSDSLLKAEIQKLLQSSRHQNGLVPQGEILRKRGPILILVNLFERNLKRGGRESLRLLAAEVESEFAIQYPREFLALVDAALTHSAGWSSERKQLISSVLKLASRSCEFDIGHFWADEVISNAPREDAILPHAMTIKAFLYFEQRDYVRAEECFQRTRQLEMMQKPSPARSFYRTAYGGMLWQQARFDEAIAIYREDIEFGQSLRSATGEGITSRALTNLAYIAGARHQWDECVELGERAIGIVGLEALNSMVLLAPVGSAKIQIGRKLEGIEDVKRGLAATAEAGMKRYHQVAFDYASTAVAKLLGPGAAQPFADANLEHRRALHHYRSPAELELLNRAGLSEKRFGVKESRPIGYLRQSPRTLNKLIVEALH